MSIPSRSIGFENITSNELLASDGDYYLFVIAIDDYSTTGFKSLNNAVLDAANLVEALLSRYTFHRPSEAESTILKEAENENETPIVAYNHLKTKCLYNQEATLLNINKHIRDLQRSITAKDNLLIYYAGHGVNLDNSAFLLPFDSKNDENLTNSWLEVNSISKKFDNFSQDQKCCHLLLILDCCYAGAVFQGRQGGNKTAFFSRKVLTSTNSKEKASDGQPQEGSPFANALQTFLSNNTKAFLKVNEHEIQTTFDNATSGTTLQSITYRYLPSDENGEGEFIFELQDEFKDKPLPLRLANCMIEHLNFTRQKSDLELQLFAEEAESENVILFSTLADNYHEQELLLHVLLHKLQQGTGINFSDGYTPFVADLGFEIPDQAQDLWVALANKLNIPMPSTEQAAERTMDWLVDKLKKPSTPANFNKPVLLWLGISKNTKSLMTILVNFWKEFMRLLKQKSSAFPSDDLQKLFVIIADERAGGELFLGREDFVNTIGKYPKIIITNPIQPINKFQINQWLNLSKNSIKGRRFHSFDKTSLENKYKLFDFIALMLEHCQYSELDKWELQARLLSIRESDLIL